MLRAQIRSVESALRCPLCLINLGVHLPYPFDVGEAVCLIIAGDDYGGYPP